jgi:putative NIF3 family GTP cyclohydrolase 1 type 2
LKKITGKNYVERTIIKAIKHDIAIFAIHTNLDNVYAGVNRKIAERIGLSNLRILVPKKDVLGNVVTHNDQQVGSGMIGELSAPEEPIEFLERLKNSMNTKCVRHTPILTGQIRTVALCGGSGSFLLPAAIRAGADVYVSADFKYHEFFDSDGRIVIADIGHYESEQFTKELISEVLREKFRTFAINFSKTVTNPIRYL